MSRAAAAGAAHRAQPEDEAELRRGRRRLDQRAGQLVDRRRDHGPADGCPADAGAPHGTGGEPADPAGGLREGVADQVAVADGTLQPQAERHGRVEVRS
nr:hypothetical protein [Pseudofrankia inefficax]